MDKDKPNQPPMPKLPDPEPPVPPAKHSFFTKREKLIVGVAGVLVVVLLALFIAMMLQAGRTPRQAVDAFAGEDLAVQEEIVMVSLPDGSQRTAYFYISGDKLACALLSRGMGGYKVDYAGGDLRLTAPTGAANKGIWKMLGTDKTDFFVFGLVYDDTVKGVKVNGQHAVLVDNGTYRCWYFYTPEAMSIDSESVVYVS